MVEPRVPWNLRSTQPTHGLLHRNATPQILMIETRFREITTFYEPEADAPPEEHQVDYVDLEIEVEDGEDHPTEGGARRAAPCDPDPAGHSTAEATRATEVIDIEDGEPETPELQGTALWIAERGSMPPRTKGPRAEQISRALTDLLRHRPGGNQNPC